MTMASFLFIMITHPFLRRYAITCVRSIMGGDDSCQFAFCMNFIFGFCAVLFAVLKLTAVYIEYLNHVLKGTIRCNLFNNLS